MNECAECGATQYEGTMFCSECGQSLIEAPMQPTNVLPFSKPARRSFPPTLENYHLRPATEPLSVTFVIPGSRHPHPVDLVDRILVGRADAEEDILPHLDLTEFDGIEKGVSREHAVLHMSDQGIIIFDLDSTNGTILNGSRLSPEKPFLLTSGDEIRFGDLLVHVFFEL
jgi:hypothetical protein